MKKMLFAVLAAMVAVACMGCKGEYPSYLVVKNTANGVTVTKYKRGIPENLVIPDGIQAIGESAFRDCTWLASVSIPDGVTAIGYSAFRDCTSLASVTIPKSVTAIGDRAFNNCAALMNVNIPEGVKEISDSTFSSCTSLANVTIPKGVTAIGENAFFGCKSLASVSIPDGVKEIGKSAFEGCRSLASVTIPGSVTEIGKEAFNGCTSLESVTIPNIAFMPCFVYRGIGLKPVMGLKELHCNGTTEQFLKVWENMENREIISDTTVFYFTDGHFTVRSIPLPNHSKYLDVVGTTVIDNKGGLPRHLVIPRGITKIGKQAFANTSIQTVTIPGTVREIDFRAFAECESLTSVSMSEGVRNISGWAFEGCKSLTSVNIPNSVTSIGQDAFDGCTSLKNVTIPKSVRYIYTSSTFPRGTRLEYLGTKAQWLALEVFLPSGYEVHCSDGDIRGK